MPFALLVTHYTHWHYAEAPAGLFHVWLNFMRYTEQLFSIRLHAHTLFSPWHRIVDEPAKKYDLEEYALSFVVNVMSRVIGFLLRTVLIITGLFVMALLGIAIIPTLLIWYAAPVVIVGSILTGLALLGFFYGYPR